MNLPARRFEGESVRSAAHKTSHLAGDVRERQIGYLAERISVKGQKFRTAGNLHQKINPAVGQVRDDQPAGGERSHQPKVVRVKNFPAHTVKTVAGEDHVRAILGTLDFLQEISAAR